MEQGRRVSDRPVTCFVLVVFCSEMETGLASAVVPNKARLQFKLYHYEVAFGFHISV